DRGQRRRVGIAGHLPDRPVAPGVRRPRFGCNLTSTVGHHSPPGLEAAPPSATFGTLGTHQKHESRLGRAASGKTRKRNPRPPSYTGGTKIARDGRVSLPCSARYRRERAKASDLRE